MKIDLPKHISENIDRFTGRAWLLPHLLNWWEKHDERLFLLTGGPGTGKSMIAAWIAGFGPEPTDSSGRDALARLRSLVKAAHFCQASSRNMTPRAFAQNIANQLNDTVRGFADAFIATLAERVQIVGTAQAGTAATGSNVAGVAIAQLNLGTLGDELSFDRGFTEPLKKLDTGGHCDPMLLVIDALDEAQTYTGVTLPYLLSRLSDLPAQIRIIATSRDDPQVLKFFRNIQPFDLVRDASRDVDDVREYSAQRLTNLVSVTDSKRTEFAERLAKEAHGIFLYAAMVLDDLLGRPPSVLPDLAAYALPPGLSGLYHEFLNRELGKDNRRWADLYRPLLGLISVAQGDGLTNRQLTAILKRELDEVGDALRACKQYLSGGLPEGPFRPFHKSFAEFLLEDTKNVDFRIDATTWHKRVGEFYLSRFHGNWKACDVYGLRHLPWHLREAGKYDELRQHLLTFGWLQAKLDATDVGAAIADFDCVAGEEDLGLLQSAIRLSAHVLAHDVRQLAGQLTGRLLSNTSPNIEALLKQAAERKAWPWLRPLKPSLTAPGGPLIRTLEGHTAWVRAVVVMRDGRRALSGSDDKTLRLWDLESGQTIHTLRGHTNWVMAVAVTPDGLRAVSAANKELRLWDLESGQALCTLKGHTDEVNAIAVMPDGRHAVSASSDRTLLLWDLDSEQAICSLRGHTGIVLAVAVTPDGRRAVSASGDKELRLWDLESGQSIHTLQGHTDAVRAVAVTPDGRRAVSASDDQTLRLWDLESGQSIHTLQGHTTEVGAVAVTPDGHRAVSGSGGFLSLDCPLRVWDLESGQTIRTLQGHKSQVNAVAVTPDGRHAVSASSDRTLLLWDLDSEQAICSLRGHTDIVLAVAVTPDGRRAVSGSSELLLWDLENGQTNHTLQDHTAMVLAVALTPDARRALSTSWDRTLRLWDLETGQTIHTLQGHTDAVRAVAITPDGRRAVSASDDQTLRLWVLETGQTIHTLQGHPGAVVAVTPDGRCAVSASNDGTLRLWDLDTGQIIRTLEGHSGSAVYAVAVTPDGRRASSVSGDQTVRIWDLESGQTIHTLQGHPAAVGAVALTPSVSGDQTLRTWHLASGQTIHTLERPLDSGTETVGMWSLESGQTIHQWVSLAVAGSGNETMESDRERLERHLHDMDPITVVRVTPDGRRAVLGTQRGALWIRDLESGQTFHKLQGHTAEVYAMKLTPDGRRALSGSDDKTLLLWDLESGRTIYKLQGLPGALVALTPDCRRAVLASGDKTLRLWDLESRKEIAAFTGESEMNKCAIAPDGRTIVAAGASGRVHFLRLIEADPTKL